MRHCTGYGAPARRSDGINSGGKNIYKYMLQRNTSMLLMLCFF
jgi:hypothetical protein